ncbi:MAG: radical SAM protein [Spirochaetes bacterium]|nr:radical SAM protein [Spirochaetota bacterium]
MKLLFVKLPAPDPDKLETAGFVPYRAACAAAWAESRGFLARDQWSFLDDDTATSGSDAAVVDAVTGAEADAVLFDCDGSTVERCTWMARKLRQRLPRTVFAAHGSEALAANPLLRSSPFDSLIEGETEGGFVDFLSDLAGRSPKPRYRSAPIDFSTAPDPYLAGTLPVRMDRTVFVEASRGRRRPRIYERSDGPFRSRAPETTPMVVRLANKLNGVDLRLVDRDSGGIPELASFWRSMAGANDVGLPISLSLSPESVNDDIARFMMDASVIAVDAPLHTVTAHALELCGGSLDRVAFETGAQALGALGIRVKPKLLVGLPGDDYETVIDSFDFLGMIGLGQDSRVEPLSVRPGTAIFDRSAEFGIKEFLMKPPYHVMETDLLAESDIADAIAAFEESFDVAWAEPIAPHFAVEDKGYVAFADLRVDGAIDRLLMEPSRLSDSLTLLLPADDPERCARAARAAPELRRENPFTMYQIVLHSDTGIPGENIVARLQSAFLQPDHYYDLSRIMSLDPQKSFQTRLFFATKSAPLAIEALSRAQDLETAFILEPGAPASERAFAKVLESVPFMIVDRDRTPFELLYRVMTAYRDYPDLIVEAPSGIFTRS